MPISIAGSGTITGISAGGLPDDCITTAEIAANAVTTAKLGSAEASGLAKAWVNFNGTGTVAIRASYNVSSITDNGTGDYTVNFTTAMADANYAANVTGTRFTSGTVDGDFRATVAGTDYFLAGSIRVIFYNTTGIASTSDAPAMCVSIFR
jgi:hypothetical protein